MCVQRCMPAGLKLEHTHCKVLGSILFGNKPSYSHIFRPLDVNRTLADIAAFLDLHLLSPLIDDKVSTKLPVKDFGSDLRICLAFCFLHYLTEQKAPGPLALFAAAGDILDRFGILRQHLIDDWLELACIAFLYEVELLG